MGTSDLTKAGSYDLSCRNRITLLQEEAQHSETGEANVNFQAAFINPTFLLHKFIVV